MGNTCTSQMQIKEKKTIPNSNTQLSIEAEHAEHTEHTSDFNFEIQEPSLVASNYEYVLAQAVNNPEKLVRRTNVKACFKHPSS
jgi:hypothetical protein